MNACAPCKKGKRKCDRGRPSCSNCARLRRECVYTEDVLLQPRYAPPTASAGEAPPILRYGFQQLGSSLPIQSLAPSGFAHPSLLLTQLIGLVENMTPVIEDFFTGTHQRISALSKLRLYQIISTWNQSPSHDAAALCLCILLIQQKPDGRFPLNMQSPLYVTIKNIINNLEILEPSLSTLDLIHCELLVAFYEMGHGLAKAAYLTLAACARLARAYGLNRKRWRNLGYVQQQGQDLLALEEEKRTWWAIVCIDRFIGLCHGDALFVTEDPERSDSLPIQDLLWSEASVPAMLEDLISAPPTLETPFTTTVGQMARESQIAHIVGRVVQHVFGPVLDAGFRDEEALQLERTLKAYVPLLAEEELKIGKYCGAYGMCNSALFILYESMLSRVDEDAHEAQQDIHRRMEETSLRVIAFASASYSERNEDYPPEIHSPYLPYSLYQAALVQDRLWKQTSDPTHQGYVELLKDIISEFTKRWMGVWQYLDVLNNLGDAQPSLALPFQRRGFISEGQFGR